MKLLKLAECSTTEQSDKFAFFSQIQELIKDFVMTKKSQDSFIAIDGALNDSKSSQNSVIDSIKPRKRAVNISYELRNEYYLQLYRFISIQVSNFDNEAGEREKYMNLMLVACVLSSYFQPASHFLASGLLHWFLSMREDLSESPI